MSENNNSFKFRDNLFGLFGVLLGGTALLITVVHFYAGSIENKPIEKQISYKEMALNLMRLKKPKKPEPVKPVFNIKTDKNLKILSGLLACLALILAALGHLKNETKNAVLAPTYIALGAIGFQLLTHSLLMLIGFILMVFLFSKLNFLVR